jgi:hypothetical protein
MVKASRFARGQIILKAWQSLNGQDSESRRKNMVAKKFYESS